MVVMTVAASSRRTVELPQLKCSKPTKQTQTQKKGSWTRAGSSHPLGESAHVRYPRYVVLCSNYVHLGVKIILSTQGVIGYEKKTFAALLILVAHLGVKIVPKTLSVGLYLSNL